MTTKSSGEIPADGGSSRTAVPAQVQAPAPQPAAGSGLRDDSAPPAPLAPGPPQAVILPKYTMDPVIITQPPSPSVSVWVQGAAAATGEATAQANISRTTVNIFAGLLLLATAALAAAAAIPILIRVISPGVAEPARRGIARVMRSKGHAVGTPRQQQRSSGKLDLFGPHHQPDRLPPDDSVMKRLGIIRAEIPLRNQPDTKGEEIGKVKAGSVVLITKELGGWVQVVSNSEGAIIAGWAKREQVSAP